MCRDSASFYPLFRPYAMGPDPEQPLLGLPLDYAAPEQQPGLTPIGVVLASISAIVGVPAVLFGGIVLWHLVSTRSMQTIAPTDGEFELCAGLLAAGGGFCFAALRLRRLK